MSSLGTSKGVLEIVKFGVYIIVLIGLMYFSANNIKNIQKFMGNSITELHDGSDLFVIVAKYLSPALHDIDQVGIMPDVQYTTKMLNSPQKGKSMASPLEADSCIMVAEHELDIQESKGVAS